MEKYDEPQQEQGVGNLGSSNKYLGLFFACTLYLHNFAPGLFTLLGKSEARRAEIHTWTDREQSTGEKGFRWREVVL